MATTTQRKSKRKAEPKPSFWARYQFNIIRGGFTLLVGSLISFVSYQIYASYMDYINPKHIYGDWIEIAAPQYRTEKLTFSVDGVFRDHRLIATEFEFDGNIITLNTGLGKTAYKTAGSHLSPQLRRIEPALPEQRFILKGFEHTVLNTETGAASTRRASLSEHFSRD